MSDFHQEGEITTLHDLYAPLGRENYLEHLEHKLEALARRIRISLLLPTLYSEIDTPEVLDRMVDEIRQVGYLHNIVVALGGAQQEPEFHRAGEYFGRLRSAERDVKIVWVEGPRIQNMLRGMQERRIPVGAKGKGQSVWVALGYLLARGESEVIALHDCDIVTYDRVLLGRLIEPTANPDNAFKFCKGFYARISPQHRVMQGRVSRLFVTPFTETMRDLMSAQGQPELARFFNYHRAFKYPLAGEFSFSSSLAGKINFAHDWALEVATLSEVYQRTVPGEVVQADLVSIYEHKHQDLSQEDPQKGLHRMVKDIAGFYLNYTRSRGFPLDGSFLEVIRSAYQENALKFIKRYKADAEANALNYDRNQEERTVAYFSDFLARAWEEVRGLRGSTSLPSWNRIFRNHPNVCEQLL